MCSERRGRVGRSSAAAPATSTAVEQEEEEEKKNGKKRVRVTPRGGIPMRSGQWAPTAGARLLREDFYETGHRAFAYRAPQKPTFF